MAARGKPKEIDPGPNRENPEGPGPNYGKKHEKTAAIKHKCGCGYIYKRCGGRCPLCDKPLGGK